jgi:hypothetical protein
MPQLLARADRSCDPQSRHRRRAQQLTPLHTVIPSNIARMSLKLKH